MVNVLSSPKPDFQIHEAMLRYAAGDILLPSLDIDSSEHIPLGTIFDGNLF
jgi:hypothetical protein